MHKILNGRVAVPLEHMDLSPNQRPARGNLTKKRLIIPRVKYTEFGNSFIPLTHRWSSDAGISRLGHPKMADAVPGKQLLGRISPSIRNRHSPYLDYITCIWVGMDSDNRIGLKWCILCKREGNKSRRDAGFSPSCFCHDAGSSIPGCRYLFGDALISSLDFMLTITHPMYFLHYWYLSGLCWRIETFMNSNCSSGIYNTSFLGVTTNMHMYLFVFGCACRWTAFLFPLVFQYFAKICMVRRIIKQCEWHSINLYSIGKCDWPIRDHFLKAIIANALDQGQGVWPKPLTGYTRAVAR